MKKEEFVEAITPFVPDNSAGIIAEWLVKNPVQLVITKDRKTKLGDFRANINNGKINKITVNGGLNKFSFLITLVHEFAHAEVFEKYGRRVQSHGKEWKVAYQQLMIEYFKKDIFPEPLRSVLAKHLKNPKASSHADLDLLRVLTDYDVNKSNEIVFLEELDEGEMFVVGNKTFIKKEKRRTRFMCQEVKSNKRYTVSAMAEVKRVV